jgi:hypothetical protein
MGKKYNKLYNDVCEALHANDRFIICSRNTHDEVVEYVAAVIGEYFKNSGGLFFTKEGLAETIVSELLLMGNRKVS